MAIPLNDNFRFNRIRRDHRSKSTAFARSSRILAERLYLSEGEAFLVTGYRGVGKTTFVQDSIESLQEMLRENRTKQPLDTPFLVDVRLNITKPMSGVELMHSLLRQLHKRLQELRILGQLPPELREKIRLSFMRTSAMLTFKESTSAEASVGLDKLIKLDSKVSTGLSQDINYLAYDERSAESDLIEIAQVLLSGFQPRGRLGLRKLFAHRTRVKMIFVFDELDKIEIEENHSSISGIIHSLKSLFTTSGISFVFVAGRSLHEQWLSETQEGDSVYESVFSDSFYVPLAWENVTDIVDPLLGDMSEVSQFERELYDDFKRYLAFKGRGLPRRILRSFHRRVHGSGDRTSLILSDSDRRQMRFHAELFRLMRDTEREILGLHSRDRRPYWFDRQRLGLLYTVDWILSRTAHSFSTKDLLEATLNLKATVAPDSELAMSISKGLLSVLENGQYIEPDKERTNTFSENGGSQEVRYRLVYRRLIEMGLYAADGAHPSSPSESSFIARHYEKLEKISSGGYSEVYLAKDSRNDELVIVKQYYRAELRDTASYAEQATHEANMYRRFNHPGIVRLVDSAADDVAEPAIVLEYVDGVSCRDFIKHESSHTLESAVAVLREVLDSLEHVHARNVIWNDLTPANIILTEAGDVKILDFGISQTTGTASDAIDGQFDDSNIIQLAGTPGYTAPERWLTGEASPSSDIFSAGVVFYEIITGKRPWAGKDLSDFLNAFDNEPLSAHPEFQALNSNVQDFISAALRREPSARHESAEAMRLAINALCEPTNIGSLVASYAASARDKLASGTGFNHLSAETRPLAAGGGSSDNRDDGSNPADGTSSNPATQTAATAFGRPRTVLAVESTSLRTGPAITMLIHASDKAHALLLVEDPMGRFDKKFQGEKVTIGRGDTNDIILRDSAISRFHAVLSRRQDGSYEATELNSINGLSVNGTRIYSGDLVTDGDRLELGNSKIVLKILGK